LNIQEFSKFYKNNRKFPDGFPDIFSAWWENVRFLTAQEQEIQHGTIAGCTIPPTANARRSRPGSVSCARSRASKPDCRGA
jgi:hypothetical protein